MKTEDIDYELAEEGKSYIVIDDELRLTMSARNWQLQKKLVANTDTKLQKKGDVSWTSFRYYMSLENALKDIIHIKTSKEFFNDAKGLIEANAKVIKQLSKAFNQDYTMVQK